MGKLCKLVLFSLVLSLSANLAIGQTAAEENASRVPSTPLKRYINDSSKVKRITLNFTDIEIRQLLQLFAQFTGTNLIIGNKVQGTMSIHLKNIPWPQALTAILKSHGLAQRRLGGTVIIAPAADIQQEQMDEIKQAQELIKLRTQTAINELENTNKIQALQPLDNRVILLKYAKAENIANMLTKQGILLTSRGALGFEAHSNSIWVRDEPSHINTIIRLIRKLDYPEKQVAIDTRIVSISRPFERQLGIKWGVSSTPGKLSGTLAGANTALTTPLNQVPVAERLNFNIPATVLQNSTVPPSTIGIALAKLGDFRVDLELSALEEEGKIELISKPRLITSNLQPAYIETGEEIPYQEATSSGATAVSFKQASLSLKVTPRITAHNRVLLEVTISNNKRGADIPLSATAVAVAIDKEEEKSTILVDSGQTIVLGGVYRQDKRKVVTRIPFLGRIPLIGFLFKHTLIRNNRNELLIFLTPRIIDKPSDLTKG